MTPRRLIAGIAGSIALAALLASPARAQEARAPTAEQPRTTLREPPLRRVTLTVDGTQLNPLSPLVAVTSEARLARRWSLAVSAGGGARSSTWPAGGTKLAWEMGAEPRWYFSGDFNSGFYVGWSTLFTGSTGARFGYESLAPPPGLSTGPFIGFKSVYVPIITPDVEIGIVTPLVTPGGEASPPLVALVGRFGIGFSL